MTDIRMSLSSLFLFLINVIIGTGVYLNSAPLCNLLGVYSFLAYLFTGILISPIIYISYKIATHFVGKGLPEIFYENFGSADFFFVLLYAFSKMSTSVIGVLFLSQSFHALVNTFFLPIPYFFLVGVIFLFCYYFVYKEFSVSPVFHKIITFAKLLPLILIILLYFYMTAKVSVNQIEYSYGVELCSISSLLKSIGVTLFAFSGFESLFSLSHLFIKNDKKIPFVLVCSFLLSLISYLVYQFCVSYLFFSVGNTISLSNHFSLFLKNLTNGIPGSFSFFIICNIAILFSAFGVSQGVLYTVIRNIYAICSRIKNNKNSIFSLLSIKRIIFFIFPVYLYIGYKNIFILQQLSSLGTIITYLLFVCCYKKIPSSNRLFFYVSLLSVLSLLIFHIYNAYYHFGFYGYFFYFTIFGILILFSYVLKKLCYNKNI